MMCVSVHCVSVYCLSLASTCHVPSACVSPLSRSLASGGCQSLVSLSLCPCLCVCALSLSVSVSLSCLSLPPHLSPLTLSCRSGGCQSLVHVGDELVGDPMERCALSALGWTVTKNDDAVERTGLRRRVRETDRERETHTHRHRHKKHTHPHTHTHARTRTLPCSFHVCL